MSGSTLVLPFATGTRVLSDGVEIAAIFCVAESERKKLGSKGLTGIAFVSKLSYPLWAIPWGNRCLLLDGMKQVADSLLYLEAPDSEAFIDTLRRNTKIQDQFFSVLRKQGEAFSAFASRKEISIKGFIANKELLSDVENFILDRIHESQGLAPRSTSLVKPRMEIEDAVRSSRNVLEQYEGLQSEIKGLRFAAKALSDETQTHVAKLQQELQQTREDFARRIASVMKEVDGKKEALMNECNLETEKLKGVRNKKVDPLLNEKRKLEKELLRLEQDKNECEKRKDLRRLRKDKVGEVRWNVRLQNVRKQISMRKERLNSLSKSIAIADNEIDAQTKRLQASCQSSIRREEKKIVEIEALRDSKLKEKTEKIAELRRITLKITSNIEGLADQIKPALSKIEDATIAWKTETPTLINLPFYVICYRIGKEKRYLLYPPVRVQENKGIMMKIRKAISGFSLQSRMNNLLKPRSNTIEKLLRSFEKRLESDKELQDTVDQIGTKNNLTSLSGFHEKLIRGLEELEAEEWIKPEEKETILRNSSIS